MTTPVAGEQFIRTLRHYLEVNESRLIGQSAVSPQHPASIPEEPSSTDAGFFSKALSSFWTSEQGPSEIPRNSNLYSGPYISLLSATSPSANSLSNIPYMPPRSTLTLELDHLYFLQVQFEALGLEENQLRIPEGGVVDTETTTVQDRPPSISSVGSIMSTLSLSTGWNIWSAHKTTRPLHEDIVYLHTYLTRITALKLTTGRHHRTIKGYETPFPQDGTIRLSLGLFRHLRFLELTHLNPTCLILDQDTIERLNSLVIKSVDDLTPPDLIENHDWCQLKMLSLADNNLTGLDWIGHLKTITHLNVSSNLLIDVPGTLSSLYNLTSLNLAYNMISFTTGINTVLGNIQELDLRGNRLSLLAGLDRLWALERLDIRDNRIEDLAEVGRLTALPNIRDIWVDNNPFTKTNTDYRVSLFSLFKKNDLDIELDGTKPSFNERRRIQIPEHEINSSTVSAKIAATTIPKAKVITRAKGNKRQIRLGEENGIPEPAAVQVEEEPRFLHRAVELEEAVQQEAVQARKAQSVRSKKSTHRKNVREKIAAIIAETNTDPNRKASDVFRKKIEAMRREAGTEWLRVLQEMEVVRKTP